jgi:lipopolysaccharide/colanic/teichoic acid biosynthesis glycosyltransferase
MQTVKEQCGTALNDKEKEYQPPQPKPVYEVCKRIFDVVMCSLALVVLSPVFLAVAIAIKREDGWKVFYSQTRLTKDAKEFKMYKFRSMCPDADQKLAELMDQNEMDGPAFKMKDDPRITKVGRFIRRTSIDELPQLWNIIRGDMSIIGPRPPLVWEVDQYTPYQMHRLDVKTGLSCYRECYGRSNIHDFDEWVESDLKYIRERSMLTDIKVILLTVKVVLSGEGAM